MSKNDFSIKFDKDTTHSNMELLFMAPKKPTMDLYVQNNNVIYDNIVREHIQNKNKASKS
jgi:hypothetical protein